MSLKTLSELYFNLIRLASIRYIFSFTDLTKSQKVKKKLIRNKNSIKISKLIMNRVIGL